MLLRMTGTDILLNGGNSRNKVDSVPYDIDDGFHPPEGGGRIEAVRLCEILVPDNLLSFSPWR